MAYDPKLNIYPLPMYSSIDSSSEASRIAGLHVEPHLCIMMTQHQIVRENQMRPIRIGKPRLWSTARSWSSLIVATSLLALRAVQSTAKVASETFEFVAFHGNLQEPRRWSGGLHSANKETPVNAF